MASNSENGALNRFGPSSMETFSGLKMDLMKPDYKQINLMDIAHHLSCQCRYAGASRRFYSVAEHSVLVADLVEYLDNHLNPKPLRFAALLHDASEAYLQDIIAPLKWLLTRDFDKRSTQSGNYRELSTRMDDEIGIKFGVRPSLFDHPAVKLADLWALKIEAQFLTVSGGRGWNFPQEVIDLGPLPPAVEWNAGLDPIDARDFFRQRFEDLTTVEF